MCELDFILKTMPQENNIKASVDDISEWLGHVVGFVTIWSHEHSKMCSIAIKNLQQQNTETGLCLCAIKEILNEAHQNLGLEHRIKMPIAVNG